MLSAAAQYDFFEMLRSIFSAEWVTRPGDSLSTSSTPASRAAHLGPKEPSPATAVESDQRCTAPHTLKGWPP